MMTGRMPETATDTLSEQKESLHKKQPRELSEDLGKFFNKRIKPVSYIWGHIWSRCIYSFTEKNSILATVHDRSGTPFSSQHA